MTNQAKGGLVAYLCHRKSLRIILVVIIGACLLAVTLYSSELSTDILHRTSPVQETQIEKNSPAKGHSHLDHDELDAYTATRETTTPSWTAHLEARQSTTLKQATQKYRLKYDRDPPPHFDRFVKFALDHKCLIDEYDLIQRDLAPFRKMDPEVLKRRIKALLTSDAMTSYSIRNGQAQKVQETYLNGAWDNFINSLAPLLPDMDVIANALDEPRVLLNVYDPSALSHANSTDPDPIFHHLERSQHHDHVHSSCTVQTMEALPTEHDDDYNAIHGLLVAPDSFSYTHDLYPVLSPTKIHPCFADIVVPPVYYSTVSPSLTDDVKWEDKEAKLFWRGSTSGGHAVNGNWRQFHRQRFMLLAKNRTDVDVAFTNIIQCDEADCEAQKLEFPTVPQEPWEEHIKHKWLFDTDGNSFSGRFTRLLRSKSLVFKSTIMIEYFSDWVLPYVHYIPVSLSYDDLDAKLRWAAENDELAKQIAEEGSQLAALQNL
ncbi:hypothetical protein SmJEL517_g05876 [Synchytrium microbalum]|uniref:Glycosyl transferase CAP10 domain-containing protein n=1 Tax=Synchytrium microbalum TaxID=1806994 RepID=A0A507BZ91_9FUNG|nr:uncharacterized protein SmJEL517_g05876 [Synchytrium microbalum]TPX30593.1 hypothetical protein SmJEL517_g05876 [Synchytrium microbalum]